MDPVTGAALISGGSSLIGGLLGNSSAKKEAQRDRDWQERMSNTAHQREAKDLEAAGLNRILSVTGKGAATGSGAMAQVGSNVLGEAAGRGVSSALTAAQLDLTKAQAKNVNADTVKKSAETDLVNANLPPKNAVNSVIDQTRDNLKSGWDKIPSMDSIADWLAPIGSAKSVPRRAPPPAPRLKRHDGSRENLFER